MSDEMAEQKTSNAERQRPMLNETGFCGRYRRRYRAESVFAGAMQEAPEDHALKRLLPLNNRTVFARRGAESREK